MAKVGEVGGVGLLSISTITLAELAFGIRILPEGRKKTELLGGLEEMLGTGMEVRPFSVKASYFASRPGFPKPVARLASGQVWLSRDIERYIEEGRGALGALR